MATKVKRGKSWSYIIKRKSLLPKPIYLTFDDEREGDAYVAQLEKLLDHGIVPDEFKQDKRTKATLGHVIDAYLEAVHVPESDSKVLGVVRGRVGESKIEAVDYQWAERWVGGMKLAGTAPSTIRHHVGALARCLDWLVRRKDSMLVANPLRMLPKRYATSAESKDSERDRRLEPDEEKRVRAIMQGKKPEGKQRPMELRQRESLLMLFDLALETAMRMREMFTLTADQVDIGKRTIFLDKTKNGDKRQVPLSSVALALLSNALDNKEAGQASKPFSGALIFPWWDGRKESLAKTTALLSQQFARIFKAAGCEDLRFHDLRHEATSRLFERTTLSDLKIATITGHRDPRMLKRYSNLRGSDLAEMMW